MTMQSRNRAARDVRPTLESIGPRFRGKTAAVGLSLSLGLLLAGLAVVFDARMERALAGEQQGTNPPVSAAFSQGGVDPWRTAFEDEDLPALDPSWHPDLTRKVYLEHRLRTFREALPGPNRLRRARQLQLLSLSVILDHAGLGEKHGDDIRVHLNERFPGERVFFLNETAYRFDSAEFPETVQLDQVLHDQHRSDRCTSVEQQLPDDLVLAIESRCQEALGFLDSHVLPGH